MNTSKFPSTIEHWPLERLVPYEKNARTHSADQIEQIANSIQEFGFTNPILVDSESGILAGHARLCAASSLNLEKVPVIVLDHLTDIQKRAYILADNQLALNAEWDDTLLTAEVKDRVASVNRMLCDAMGRVRVSVDPRSRELRSDFLKVSWKRGAEGFDLDKKPDPLRTT